MGQIFNGIINGIFFLYFIFSNQFEIPLVITNGTYSVAIYIDNYRWKFSIFIYVRNYQ